MSYSNSGRSAVIWCTDGGDYKYWKYSIASMRMHIEQDCDFIVLTLPSDDLHGLDLIYGLRRIDPTPYMATLGFTKEGYDTLGNRWPVAILYKLCVPLIGRLKGYKSVMTLDTDVMAMPTSKMYTVDDVLNHPMGEFEVAGVPDLYEPFDRVATLINEKITGDIRDELRTRVWDKYGYGCQSYISAGLFLWNIPVIDRDIDWYIRRCKAFWPNIAKYTFPEQDFVNGYMGVDSRLQSTFGARGSGNGPYVVANACMRHFTGPGKRLMYNMGDKIPEICPTARFEQANLLPRNTDVVIPDSPKKCIVWTCGDTEEEIAKLHYAIDSMKDVCGELLDDIDLFVVTTSSVFTKRLKRDDVTVIDANILYTLSGFGSMCNWRSGRISWNRWRLNRLFIPYIQPISQYDLALHLDGDMIVTDKRILDIFDTDVNGYDCAMSAEFMVSSGLYYPHNNVRFCKANLQAMYTVKDSNVILGRLNNGIYFSSSVCLFNVREFRRTYSPESFFALGVSCIGNGAPGVEGDLLNCACLVKRVSGSYNTAGTTHFIGEPVYCVHNYRMAKEGEKYPNVNNRYYL